jgi:hypothetical protein
VEPEEPADGPAPEPHRGTTPVGPELDQYRDEFGSVWLYRADAPDWLAE